MVVILMTELNTVRFLGSIALGDVFPAAGDAVHRLVVSFEVRQDLSEP